ncbi:enoyl-CoA hydratase-related protein [Nakamurella leprariae]|uniref:Enoyl-CoA hydratase/isomerase family protein n=1 Tax=Nakamurella leprariae TaxID=2803911 RepID=A0A939BY12_9ACTN|nr:enoyl-CoA hydratase-related protein [Nakamurella leprariae]MBM9466136.1 enoyl-CoA hydratase/isomerase family protein [Nakamurella leprariae]
MSDELLVTHTDGIVQVVLNRPHRHNALTHAMVAELHELITDLAADRTARVLVLRGAGGRAFAAGNDIADFLEHEPVAHQDRTGALVQALFALPQVTVAAVDGVCAGGGLALASHCDLRLATRRSRFGYPVARTLGNALPTALLARCAAVFGEPLTREMLLTARLVPADRAHGVGALTDLVDDATALEEALASLLADLEPLSGATIRATKAQLLTQAQRLTALTVDAEQDHELVRQAYAGADFTEGVRAFLAKERPAFER